MAKHFLILAAMAMLFCARASDPGFRSIELAGLENVFVIGPRIYSGSSPEDDVAFESLKKLGVKTLLSVDGIKPDVKRAHEFGMRYIHLPHGYDGISRQRQIELAKAASVADGKIYVHCHHGKHRGPAAVAIICMAKNGWSAAQAENWLHAAGTATNYTGLFATVRNFQFIPEARLNAAPTDFPESQKISDLVDTMVEIDHRFDNLKATQKAGFKIPAAENEATLLIEHFRELQRTPEAKSKGESFLNALRDVEENAKSFEALLKSPQSSRESLEKSFSTLANQCAACHKQFRD